MGLHDFEILGLNFVSFRQKSDSSLSLELHCMFLYIIAGIADNPVSQRFDVPTERNQQFQRFVGILYNNTLKSRDAG